MNASRADEAVARGWGIPLLRPQLPTAKQLSGYLERIDATRWYSNNGPLTRQLERRLAEHFGAPEGSVVCTCNGTLGLTLTLMNLRRRPGDLC
ncbi:MAG TPA: DegT/DnrJ/EryC1/StrS family aminotransferase, partial [Candidatus Cybelea sp.]